MQQTDDMMLGIRKEMSNFLTIEEAELMINRRNAIIDPGPFITCDCREYMAKLISEIDRLNYQVQHLKEELEDTKNNLFKNDIDEPTI